MLGTNIFNKLTRSQRDSEARAQTYFEKGMRFVEQSRYADAIIEFKQAIRTDSDFSDAKLELGLTYHKIGRTNDAIKAYLAALESNSELVKAYRNLGIAYDSQGDFVKALKMYCKAIRLKPHDLELRKNLGLAYFNIGSYAEATKAYQQVLRTDPTDSMAHYYLGLVHLDLDDKNSALEEKHLLEELGHHEVAGLLADEIDKQTLRVNRGARVRPNSSTSQLPIIPSDVSERGEGGFSILELLIVVVMISVVMGFALLQITSARQDMVRENAAREFAGFLEKARIDSLRRHATSTAQMAQVSLVNRTFYTVAIDTNGDGTLDAPRVISLPVNSDLEFNNPLPRTIYFNWRGRTVDASGNIASPAFVTISSRPSKSSRIDLSTAGQSALQGLPATGSVSNSTAPAPNFRPNTRIP